MAFMHIFPPLLQIFYHLILSEFIHILLVIFYRSKIIEGNKLLDQDFDFNSSRLSRNTFPYKVNDPYAGSEFLLESNEIVDQITKVEDVTKGSVESLEIASQGKDYQVGDLCVFESVNEKGGGLSAFVSEIEGLSGRESRALSNRDPSTGLHLSGDCSLHACPRKRIGQSGHGKSRWENGHVGPACQLSGRYQESKEGS
jgi:hypothetical protein